MNRSLFQRIDCHSLPVPDLESAIAFYESLGHEPIWRDKRAAGLRLPGCEAELVLHTDGRPAETDFTVESVPEAVDAFVEAGGRVVRGPFEIRIGLCAVLADPWDNPIVILDNSKGLLAVDAQKRVIGYREEQTKDNSRLNMTRNSLLHSRQLRRCALLFASAIVFLSILTGCAPSTEDLKAVDYAPLPEGDWKVSTPEEQGLEPMLLAKLYHEAAEMETLYGLLVIKNGHLIAEKYFNEGSLDQVSGRASATKSFTSALVGIALEQGCLKSLDQKMIDFFPEFADEIQDPRKEQITIRHLLQMRGGYPDEQFAGDYFDIMFYHGNWKFLPHLVDFPLASDPGTRFHYSNLTSHLLGVIVTRACGQDLETYAQQHLFSPMDAELYGWQVDDDGYNWGFGEIYVTARNMAKFGQLYLDGGLYEGKQILSADWIEASHQRYSENVIRGWLTPRYGSFRDRGYGYQWWSSRVGDHDFWYASGHGSNYIILLRDLDMVIVTTADPLHDMWEGGGDPWKYAGAINRMVGRFIRSLPSE